MNQLLNQVIGGRYYVLELLGKGGFSIVYKVKDIHTGCLYALKEYITSDPANEAVLLKGMERELHILRGTSHPVLPRIYNLIKIRNRFFLVLEWIKGMNLREYIKRYGRMSDVFAYHIIVQICSGLYYLHSLEPPIIYRDLKPANIILQNNGSVKLIDFGIAKRYRSDMDVDELAAGSRGFAAPEQFAQNHLQGFLNTDIRTDIYGIGTTMFYLKTGKIFQGRFPMLFPRRMKRIITKCTQKNPQKRYGNCIDILREIKLPLRDGTLKRNIKMENKVR